MNILLIATVAAKLVGFVEVAPGICRTDYIIDGSTIKQEIVHCNAQLAQYKQLV
jgi:hypothetical protein